MSGPAGWFYRAALDLESGAARGLSGLALVALVFLFWPADVSPAMAQSQSAGELHEMCAGSGPFAGERKEKAEGVCWGFIAAIGEVLVSGHSLAGIAVCPPWGRTPRFAAT